jgi:hypothetical protein
MRDVFISRSALKSGGRFRRSALQFMYCHLKHKVNHIRRFTHVALTDTKYYDMNHNTETETSLLSSIIKKVIYGTEEKH